MILKYSSNMSVYVHVLSFLVDVWQIFQYIKCQQYNHIETINIILSFFYLFHSKHYTWGKKIYCTCILHSSNLRLTGGFRIFQCYKTF